MPTRLQADRVFVMARDDKFRVVIAGGGVAALEAMVALRALAEERVDVTLVAPDDVFIYRPLAVAEPFGGGAVPRFSLPALTTGCGASYERGAVMLVSPDARTVYTSRARTLEYDALVLAPGARAHEGVRGALTFSGPADTRAIEMLLEDLRRGLVHRVVFAVPIGVSWTLPVYELALLTAEECAAAGIPADLIIVTPEELPLGIFDGDATPTIRRLLDDHGIALRTGLHPRSFSENHLELVGADSIEADSVVALPRLSGRIVEGVPHNAEGFIATDPLGRVPGLPKIYAAGDITTFPLKQGGIAAQQADAIATAIASEAGVDVAPAPFEPVLRGLLLAGEHPAYLRAEIGGGRGDPAVLDKEPLWWPAGKIAARYLGPYLAEHARSPSASRYEPSRLLV
jgi:sulfide:quinone oxidoreductase